MPSSRIASPRCYFMQLLILVAWGCPGPSRVGPLHRADPRPWCGAGEGHCHVPTQPALHQSVGCLGQHLQAVETFRCGQLRAQPCTLPIGRVPEGGQQRWTNSGKMGMKLGLQHFLVKPFQSLYLPSTALSKPLNPNSGNLWINGVGLHYPDRCQLRPVRICNAWSDQRGGEGCDKLHACDVRLPTGDACQSTRHNRMSHPE